MTSTNSGRITMTLQTVSGILLVTLSAQEWIAWQALKSEEQLNEVLKPHNAALEYWKSLLGKANAD